MTTATKLNLRQIKQAVKKAGYDPKEYRIGWQSGIVCSISGIGFDKKVVNEFSESLTSLGIKNTPIYHFGSITIQAFQ